jgi:putative ABC transport system ATP-binding protein
MHPSPAPMTDRALGTAPLLSLRSLDKAIDSAGQKLFLLRRIDLDVAPGDFVTIMGPSGAGKSTLLSILGMLDHSWTGEFHFMDEAVHRMKPRDRIALNKQYIGFVFQQYHLIDDLTVAENIDIPLSYRNVPKSERQAIVADVLDRFNMVAKKDLYPRQLSGGQQQLVGIARAVVARPKLILADEPTGNLHTAQGREIMELFKRLNAEGTTIIQVTHSEENARYGNRIVSLQDGWIVSS